MSACQSIDYQARATAHRVAATCELRRFIRMVIQAQNSRQYPLASWWMAWGAMQMRLRHEGDYRLAMSHLEVP